MKIAITGATGLVGSRIVELLSNDFAFIPLKHDAVDITDAESVKKTLENLDYDLLLHCAGYTNVDGAETEKEKAYLLNVTATKNLFELSQKKQKKFVYISTDFVFNGTEGPYDENSTPNPIGQYGQTKYEGEQIVENKAMIVRISYPYRARYEKRLDFFRSIKSLLEQNKTVAGITDSIITPTFIDDIAFGLKHLMISFQPQIYHLVGGDSLSPYDSFETIANVFNLDKGLISKTTYNDFFQNKAKRPKLGKTISIKNTFQKMKSFREALIEISASIK